MLGELSTPPPLLFAHTLAMHEINDCELLASTPSLKIHG